MTGSLLGFRFFSFYCFIVYPLWLVAFYAWKNNEVYKKIQSIVQFWTCNCHM